MPRLRLNPRRRRHFLKDGTDLEDVVGPRVEPEVRKQKVWGLIGITGVKKTIVKKEKKSLDSGFKLGRKRIFEIAGKFLSNGIKASPVRGHTTS